MSRWVCLTLCVVLGLLMLVCGLLVPMHLRAVDAGVLKMAGRNTPSLVERGLALAKGGNLGAAELLLQAARQEVLPEREVLRFAVTNLAQQHQGWQSWGGGDDHLQVLFEGKEPRPVGFEPLTDWAVRLQNRETALEFLRASHSPAVQELLRCRELTNTVLFPPSLSASGQALDAALVIGGLLLEERSLTPGLSNAVLVLAGQARSNSQPLEQVLLDLMSLGQRFNWTQLADFISRIEEVETLHRLAGAVRTSDPPLAAGQADGAPAPLAAVVFSAVELSGKPAAVASYLVKFSGSGMRDLGASLRYGSGGVSELLARNHPLYRSSLREQVASLFPLSAFFSFALDYSWRISWVALAMKWLLYLAGGFLLAAALHYGRPAVAALERPLQVRGFHLAREMLFALGFLLAVLLLSEPFLAQENRKTDYPLKLGLHVSITGGAASVGTTNVKSSLMNAPILLTLLLFFVLQALLYTACLVKLAEIRRQPVAPRIKLKLLENEDHLFDAGLYLGFLGTIVSLILFSVGVIKLSLMSAYSSTSFGILFVSVFKIFHLRPTRRRLLMEAEVYPEPVTRAATAAYATQS
jgi:hypothetical protein